MENQMVCTIILVWDKLLKILSVSLSSWWGALLCLRYFHGGGAITHSEQQSQSPHNSATKKLQHPPFNFSNYTGCLWGRYIFSTLFSLSSLFGYISTLWLLLFEYYWFVQMVSTLDFLKFPVAFNKATHLFMYPSINKFILIFVANDCT